MDWEKIDKILAEMEKLFVELESEQSKGESAENQFDDSDEIVADFGSLLWRTLQSWAEMDVFVMDQIDSGMWRKEA